MSCTLQPRFHPDEGVTQKNPPFSPIVYHFSTSRRSERYSRGIGLIKSTVTPFLARGLNETPIFRSLLPDYKDKIKEIIMLLRSRGFPCLSTALRVFTCIPGGRYFAECVTPSPPPRPHTQKKGHVIRTSLQLAGWTELKTICICHENFTDSLEKLS